MSLTEIDEYAGPSGVVGRTRETELLRAALDSGAHVVLEGPAGTGKSTLLRAVAASTGRPFHFVEGNADLTPSRLTGHFDPAQVLSRGYQPDVYVDGPLVAALRAGALLYLEELNRVPEETLNVLLGGRLVPHGDPAGPVVHRGGDPRGADRVEGVHGGDQPEPRLRADRP